MPVPLATGAKAWPYLLSLSRIRNRGPCFPELLSYPGIIGTSGHAKVYQATRFQLDDDKHEDGAEKQIMCLEEVNSPDLLGMIAQECGPCLFVREGRTVCWPKMHRCSCMSNWKASDAHPPVDWLTKASSPSIPEHNRQAGENDRTQSSFVRR